ncbi:MULTISPECIES: hypothetical protein [Eikenella]|nr:MULTISPECIES: hypothetical protein [Eikenella]
MMKRLAWLLAAALAAGSVQAAPEGDTGYAHGANHCYGFRVPAGWIQDNRLLADKGVPMVFLPQEGGLRAARVMMYTGSIAPRPGGSFAEAVRAQVNDVAAQYAGSGEQIRPAMVRRIRSRGSSGELWRFTGYRSGGQELAAYFPGRRSVNYFVAQVPARADAAAVESALLRLAGSYHERESCPPCREQGCAGE